MNRYAIIGQLGDGSFGVVSKAQNNATGEVVAVKKMKQRFHSWDECLQLREVQSLRKLQHPNVIKLKEVVRERTELFLIFEYCECNVLQIMRDRMEVVKGAHAFNEREIRSIMCQMLLGIQAVHKSGFMHRDLKPENLLVKGDCVKVADFGLAKEIRSRPPFTEYVSTRWYRAPEVVLHSRHYNSPVDIWACGVIFAELLLCRPLFPGTSESDQLFKICSVLGTPSPAEWDEGYALTRRLNLRFPAVVPTPLRQLLADAPPAAVELIELMLRFNPSERPTVVQCLQHPFFTGSGANTGSALYAGISTGQPHNPFLTPANTATPLAAGATTTTTTAHATVHAGSPFTGLVSCNATPLSASTVTMSKYASLFSHGTCSPCVPAQGGNHQHNNNHNNNSSGAGASIAMHGRRSSSIGAGNGGVAGVGTTTTTTSTMASMLLASTAGAPSVGGGHAPCGAMPPRHKLASGGGAAVVGSGAGGVSGGSGGGGDDSDDEFNF